MSPPLNQQVRCSNLRQLAAKENLQKKLATEDNSQNSQDAIKSNSQQKTNRNERDSPQRKTHHKKYDKG